MPWLKGPGAALATFGVGIGALVVEPGNAVAVLTAASLISAAFVWLVRTIWQASKQHTHLTETLREDHESLKVAIAEIEKMRNDLSHAMELINRIAAVCAERGQVFQWMLDEMKKKTHK